MDAFRHLLHRTPLLLPLLALLGVLLLLFDIPFVGYPLLLLSLLSSLMLQEWRLFFCSVLVSGIALLHLGGMQQEASHLTKVLLAQDEVELQGYIIRRSESRAFLQLKDSCLKVELRGELLRGELGDELKCRGEAQGLAEEHLPGTFDREAWLRSQGVFLALDVHDCQHVADAGWNLGKLYAFSAHLRERALQRLMPEGTQDDERRQVLCALILGERSVAEAPVLEAFQWSGTMHAFAVSGLHVGLIAALLWGFFRLVRLPVRVAQALILVLLASYVLMTGMAVSSLRAYFMIFFFLLGFMMRRQVTRLNIYCAVMLMVLLVDPMQLQQLGFLLSFSIYGAICLAVSFSKKDSPYFGPDEYLPSVLYRPWDRLCYWFEASLRASLVISCIAFIVSLPLMATSFGLVNIYSIPSNICMSFLLPLCMLFGLLCLVPYVGVYATPVAMKLAGGLLAIGNFFAALPASHLYLSPAQQPSAYCCLGLRYSKSATMLGNPGLVLSDANELTTRWSVCPALSAAGFDAALLLDIPRFSKNDALQAMQRFWRSAQLAGGQQQRYVVGENHYSIYPAPLGMKRPRIRDTFPIIHWQKEKGSLLYIGDASASTLYFWLEQGAHLQAQTAIIGYNDKQPVNDMECLRTLGVKEIILLPNAPAELYDESQGQRLLHLRENKVIQSSL